MKDIGVLEESEMSGGARIIRILEVFELLGVLGVLEILALDVLKLRWVLGGDGVFASFE